MVRVLVGVIALGLAVHTSFAAPTDVALVFAKATQDYAEGSYAAAQESYDKLVKAGSHDPAVYLNLGHTEYRLGNYVKAAMNYQRALALDPGSAAARSSLDHVAAKLGVVAPGLSAPEIVGRYIPFDILAILGSVLFWVGLCAVLFAMFSEKKRKGLLALGIFLAFAGATASVVSWAGDTRITMQRTAVVVGKDVDVREVPTDNAKKLTRLSPGTSVQVIAERGGWTLLVGPMGMQGWVPSGDIEMLAPKAQEVEPVKAND